MIDKVRGLGSRFQAVPQNSKLLKEKDRMKLKKSELMDKFKLDNFQKINTFSF